MGRLVSVDSLRLPGGLMLSSAVLERKGYNSIYSGKILKNIKNLAFFTNSVLPGDRKVPTAVEGTPGAKDEEIYAW